MELSINNLVKNYGNVKALKEVNITLNEGVYGLLGPNGAGKSTLMNILVGNIKSTSGEVLFEGKEIQENITEYVSNIGYMPQQQQMYDSFTAYRFLNYMAALKGMKKDDAKKQIMEVLKLVNLSDRVHDKIGGFSGGMKQRLLLAQALLNNPKILILDEPTAGLDPKERIRIRNLISSISFGKIVIVATHVVSDIEIIADRIVFIKKGVVVNNRKPQELVEEIQGNVYEMLVEQSIYEEIKDNFVISSIFREGDKIRMRVVIKDKVDLNSFEADVNKLVGRKCVCQQVLPTIDDYYLYVYQISEEN